MENDSVNILKGEEPRDFEAAREIREREANVSIRLTAPRAVEKQETNTTCQGKTAESTGARDTNVPEKETAAVRRDEGPLTIADQQLRKEDPAASRPPGQNQKGAVAEAGQDPGEGAKNGGCRPNIIDISRAGTPASQASKSGSASRRRCLRRQLTLMLKEGTDCFSPDDVRRIIRAARSGPEGSLDAVCMLDDDVSLFTHAFPDADESERRAHCLSTLLEYEESMQAWEEARNAGELGSDSDSSEDEDELTGSELLRDLDPPAPCPPADTIPTARSGRLEWPKKVLEQTNLVSSIAAEIERNTNRADWDAECYEGCQKLLQREVQRMGAISDDRGQEEVSVLTELEVQRWVDEALENAARATKSILGKLASLGVHHPNQDSGEASDFDIADSKAAQTVMRTATAYPSPMRSWSEW